MKNLPGLSEIVILLLVFGLVSAVSGISIVANKQNDPHNCQISPNNQGCSLHRPIDMAKKTHQNTSFQFVYDPQEDTMRLIKVSY